MLKYILIYLELKNYINILIFTTSFSSKHYRRKDIQTVYIHSDSLILLNKIKNYGYTKITRCNSSFLRCFLHKLDLRCCLLLTRNLKFVGNTDSRFSLYESLFYDLRHNSASWFGQYALSDEKSLAEKVQRYLYRLF